jgi:protein-disulfide reductase (glutathione)
VALGSGARYSRDDELITFAGPATASWARARAKRRRTTLIERSKPSTSRRDLVISTFAICLVLLTALPAAAGGDWNDSGVSWQSYEAGLAKAKEEKKPVMLIFYTDWCPHCTKYSGIFHNSDVVEMSKKFVMIRLNKEKNPSLSGKYAPDGEYIPRTFFLTSEGELRPSIHEQRDKYQYFYSTTDPASILRAMKEALGDQR